MRSSHAGSVVSELMNSCRAAGVAGEEVAPGKGSTEWGAVEALAWEFGRSTLNMRP